MTYHEIAADYSVNPRDVHTVPITEKQPLWFYVYTDNGTMFVKSAKEHAPSSRITGRRKLIEDEFEDILSIYWKRKCGLPVSKEATDTTKNQVYWYGVFSEMNL